MGRRRIAGAGLQAGTGSGPVPAQRVVQEAGRSRVTISDVAARARVSKSAVSFVFNGRRGLSEATTERILRAADDLGWKPNARARALSLDRPRSVGLVVGRHGVSPGACSDLAGFIDGVGTALAATDTALVVRVVSSAAEETGAYDRFVRESQVDGILIVDLRTSDDRPAALTALGLPFLVAEHVVAHADEWEGTAQAVRHLAGAGHERIAIVAETGTLRSARRQKAFADESRALGLSARVIGLTDPSPASARTATDRLLGFKAPPTGILYDTGLLASAGMGVIGRRGMRVPESLSVISLDDSSFALVTEPAITSVRRDAYAWGRACGLRLVALLGGDPVAEVELPPAELVVRASTAPPSTTPHERSR
ncbi:LacI family DNA-binding transcriptional regulator [Leifsonia sp. PS1209]|uniref:LacI family DNA-binding transcriptional regulator n=1 Tax=Leifsonia sp. PS1209 TaxID=2724914 RepID=UPI001442CBA7|nr:LacI family DNA-binding transcriptional regulator [Leifsonia sp. PS1209]QJA00391.1 LacI family transcriptional regulator [Leifsonia sp. PS1209]